MAERNEAMPRTMVEVGSIDDIPMLGSRVVETKTGNIAVFRTRNDEIFALTDACPHKKGPLSQGIVHGKRVTCPLHNWVIALDNGEAVAPDVGCARVHDVRLEGRKIFVDAVARE